MPVWILPGHSSILHGASAVSPASSFTLVQVEAEVGLSRCTSRDLPGALTG